MEALELYDCHFNKDEILELANQTQFPHFLPLAQTMDLLTLVPQWDHNGHQMLPIARWLVAAHAKQQNSYLEDQRALRRAF